MAHPIRFILSHTSHPGNIGAAARAMKNMGFTQLVLVAPESFPDPIATARASGADDILNNARVVESLATAVADCQWVYGTSARQRSLPWPLHPINTISSEIAQNSEKDTIAIVFGQETSGLTNEELALCDAHITIPTVGEYASLNLAAAVQVVAYELSIARRLITQEAPLSFTPLLSPKKATQGDLLRLMQHFKLTATHLGFFDPNNPKKLMPRVKRMFAKTQLEREEVDILRGWLKAVDGLLARSAEKS